MDDFLSGIKPDACGDLGTVFLPGDTNKDCYVNMLDLVDVFSDWLECNDPDDVACT